MQISGSNPALNTLRLSLTTEAQRNSLLGRLSEGQTIQARVDDELSTGRWAIRFMGHTLVAESRLALRPGQTVETRVHEVGPPLVLSISGRPGSEAAAVRTALHQLGLKDDATNRAIIASLIRNGLGVDRGEVTALRDFLSGLGDSPLLNDLDELVDRILFLRGKGIPVTPDSIAAFYSTTPPGTLAGLLEGLAGLLRDLKKRSSGSSERLRDILTTITDSSSADLTPEDARRMLDRLGLDLEARLGRETVEMSLRPALLQLLASGDLNADQSQLVENLIRYLNTLQASVLPGTDDAPILLQLPFHDGRSLNTTEIRISRGGEDGSVDPERLTLSVSLCLSVLGDIRIDLSSYQSINTCRIRVASRDAHDHLAPELTQLSDGLSRAGYPVTEVKLHLESVPTDSPDETRPRIGVDFKA